MGAPINTTWEAQYHAKLVESGNISQSGLAELRKCTDQAFSFISPSADSGSSFVAGALVGAIQSGKTRLMISLAARALDAGYRCVIVLAGLRDDLRTQTALRFYSDLLDQGASVPESLGGGFTHPKGLGYHGARRDCWSPAPFDDVNHDQAFGYLLSTRLRRGDAVLAVAKKNVTTLNHLRASLQYAVRQNTGVRLPILVIDDECDEASVAAEDEAPTAERIAELWRGLDQEVAYVGFTATPAANLLQDPSSELFPGRFVLTMRSPGDAESALTYSEPAPDGRYTGGHTFYQFLDAQNRPNFLVEADMSDEEFDGQFGHDETLEEALLSYFVSGAIRLVEQGMPEFSDAERPPRPHTMLAHTESSIASHWKLCERIIGIVRTNGGQVGTARGNVRRVRPEDRIQADDLEVWLRAQPSRWRAWYEDFRRSRAALLEISPDRIRSEIPAWEQVVAGLLCVFSGVKLRVLNSDDTSLDPPLQFKPSYSLGTPQLPTDIYSIVIGGNRLSRGLTLEGLCTSYYTRTSLRMVEDTTVQRERWFGYRGSHLEFCRVFTHPTLALRLRRFNEHDEDLRRQLAWHVETSRSPADATFRFLTITGSAPTSKLGRGRGPMRIDPSGTRVFVDRVQMGNGDLEESVAAANQDWADRIADRILNSGTGLKRDLGHVLVDIGALEAADLLESLSYTFHNPDPERGIGSALKGFYKVPDVQLPITDYGFLPSSDPYLIAAFLRYWQSAFQQCALTTGQHNFRGPDGVAAWEPCPAPRFNIAVRYGSLPPAEDSPFTFPLLDREVDRAGFLGSRWGGRRGGVGDEWIDIERVPTNPDAARSKSSPGLVLIHVIGRQATGRNGYGVRHTYDRPCVGIVVPEGGPSIEFVLAEGSS